MPTIHPSAKAKTDAALTPAKRRHEVAAILAEGDLVIPDPPPELRDGTRVETKRTDD